MWTTASTNASIRSCAMAQSSMYPKRLANSCHSPNPKDPELTSISRRHSVTIASNARPSAGDRMMPQPDHTALPDVPASGSRIIRVSRTWPTTASLRDSTPGTTYEIRSPSDRTVSSSSAFGTAVSSNTSRYECFSGSSHRRSSSEICSVMTSLSCSMSDNWPSSG